MNARELWDACDDLAAGCDDVVVVVEEGRATLELRRVYDSEHSLVLVVGVVDE